MKSPGMADTGNRGWHTNASIGSKESGMYTRAFVALKYLFALKKEEVIYYTAFTDEDGQLFRTDCDYRVTGKNLDTGWWSITAYGPDHFLISNDQNRYSFLGSELINDKDKAFQINLSSTFKKGKWLPTGSGRTFNLVLRLYNPGPQVYKHLGTYDLPRIIKENCQ